VLNCCGSGGMFVQAERFLEAHGGRIGELAIYGQESNYTTWRLCKMNLAVRGIHADIRWNNEGSFHRDELKDKPSTSSSLTSRPTLCNTQVGRGGPTNGLLRPQQKQHRMILLINSSARGEVQGCHVESQSIGLKIRGVGSKLMACSSGARHPEVTAKLSPPRRLC
jgi:hypothetical protein